MAHIVSHVYPGLAPCPISLCGRTQCPTMKSIVYVVGQFGNEMKEQTDVPF